MKIGSIVMLKSINPLLQEWQVNVDMRNDYGIGVIVGYTDNNADRCWLVSWPRKGFKQWRSPETLEVIG